MSWLDYQKRVRDVLLLRDPEAAQLEALGADTDRWRAYRRMVRSRFYQVVDHAFEHTIAVIGVERFHTLQDHFLAHAPPRSPYLRDVPAEFLRFVEGHPAILADPAPLPPYMLDLMRLEWAELDTAYDYEEVRPDDVVPLEMERIAVLSPSHRLLDLEYAVQGIGADGTGAPMAPSPQTVCLYRDRATHEVETLVLTPVAATVLREIDRRTTPLAEIVRNAAEAHRVSIDVAFVEALSTLLADLTERGVLLGSLASTETPR